MMKYPNFHIGWKAALWNLYSGLGAWRSAMATAALHLHHAQILPFITDLDYEQDDGYKQCHVSPVIFFLLLLDLVRRGSATWKAKLRERGY